MLEIGVVLRAAYYAKLNGNVTLNSVAIPVYDSFAPDSFDGTGTFYYILLSTLSEIPTQTTNKDNFSANAAFTVDIVTGFTQVAGFKTAELIADQVKHLICPHDPASFVDLTPGFQNADTQQQLGQTLTERTATHFIYRKVIRFKHLIYQLTAA